MGTSSTPFGILSKNNRVFKAALAILIVLIFLIVLNQVSGIMDKFPASLQFSIRDQVDNFTDWLTFESPLRRLFFNPVSDFIEALLDGVEGFLQEIPWVVFVVGTFLLANRTAGRKTAIFSLVSLTFIGAVGSWNSAMSTLTLVGISVFVSLLIGIPFGIIASRNDTVDSILRTILDTMQTMPAFVYLIPVMMLFGLGKVAGVVATIVYAIPPVTRLTNLGIRQVSKEVVEASNAFGASKLQTLFKVELPLAMPSIMMGINQTIMMALSMVVIAALVGSRGLGADVWSALRRLEIGKGLEGGLAIVFIAIILDRISFALVGQRKTDSHPHLEEDVDFLNFIKRYRYLIISVFVLGILYFASLWVEGFVNYPGNLQFSLQEPVGNAVRWMNINLFDLTSFLHEILFRFGLKPIRDLLYWLPWPVLILIVSLVAYVASGWRLALFSSLGLLCLGILGEWELSMDTLSQVIVGVVLSMTIALPTGILASRSDRLETMLRPLLDTLQTMPNFVYLIPVVMLFGVGAVSGLIATVFYAIPPAIRLTNLGIRQVSRESVEASQAFGATTMQTLFKVQLPLALPSIMLGINQTIMMALAMVIVTALIGATGLGLEVAVSIARLQTGKGFEASIAIVLLAIILDRITQAWSTKRRKMLSAH